MKKANGKFIKEILDQWDAQLDALIKVRQQKMAALTEAIKQGKDLLSKQDAFRRSLPEKKPTGRKGKWKGKLGFELLTAVEEMKKTHGTKRTAEAIKILQHASSRWREYEQRELEARHSEAKKFWAPWI